MLELGLLFGCALALEHGDSLQDLHELLQQRQADLKALELGLLFGRQQAVPPPALQLCESILDGGYLCCDEGSTEAHADRLAQRPRLCLRPHDSVLQHALVDHPFLALVRTLDRVCSPQEEDHALLRREISYCGLVGPSQIVEYRQKMRIEQFARLDHVSRHTCVRNVFAEVLDTLLS